MFVSIFFSFLSFQFRIRGFNRGFDRDCHRDRDSRRDRRHGPRIGGLQKVRKVIEESIVRVGQHKYLFILK